MTEDYKDRIGNLIRDARKHRGLTQAQLAERLGTSQSAINRIEKGHQNLSLEMVARIGAALDSEIVALGAGPTHLRVSGPTTLSGAIDVKTSKNAGVALLCASLLNRGRTTLRKVARIEEVNRLLEVLSSLGVQTRWLNDNNDLEIVPPVDLKLDAIDEVAARRTRSVIMFLGPLLHRAERFDLPYAGGCNLGTRTVEPHMSALRPFGLDVVATDGSYHASVRTGTGPGRAIVLTERGDTVTENALMAAALHPGTTVIRNASSNYMVQDLCFYLERLGVQGVVGQVGVQQLQQPGVGGIRGGPRHQHRQGRHALAQVGARGLARLDRLRGDVQDVVGELEGRAHDLAVRRECTDHLLGGAAEVGAVPRRGGDQRAGLPGHDLEIVRQRVFARLGLHGLQDLPLHQPGEGLRLDPHRLRAEIGGHLRGAAEQEVPGEDRDQVVPPGVGGVGAPAQVGLVHHVVVVERGHVGQLDHAGGLEHLVVVRVLADLRGQQHQQRAEAFPARGEQVPRGVGDIAGASLAVSRQHLLDDPEPAAETVGEGLVEDGQGEGCGLGGRSGHRRKSPAWAARSRTGPGRTPSTRVMAAANAIVVAVSTEG